MGLIIGLLVVVAVGGVVLAVVQANRPGLAAKRAADPDEFRNHLDMARLIERLMENDFVRGVIPEGEQRTARRVLQEFYGDDGPATGQKEIGR